MFSFRYPLAIATSLAVSFCLADIAHAQIFVTADQTINTNVSGQEVFVGKDNKVNFATLPSTPLITLTVDTGAVINSTGSAYPDGKTYADLSVFGAHHANIIGGSVDQATGYNSSQINVSGGQLNTVTMNSTGTVTVTGGNITQLAGRNSSRINIDGGTVGTVASFEATQIEMTNGSVGTAGTRATGVMNVKGGTVQSLFAASTSTINVSAGNINHSFSFDNASLNITGGTVALTEGYDSGIVNIKGGTVTDAHSFQTSTLNISGGTITNGVNPYDTSTLNITGSGLSTVVSNVYGYYKSSINYRVRDYAVSGTLSSGDVFSKTITAADIGSLLSETAIQLRGVGFDVAPDLYVTAGMDVADVYNKVTIGQDITGTVHTSPTVTLGTGFDAGRVLTFNNSQVTFSAGIIHSSITAADNSEILITGGNVTDLTGSDNSIFTISGGQLGTNTIRVSENSVVNIYGTGLSFALVGIGSDSNGSYTAYTLSGQLQNHQSLNGVRFLDYDGGLSIGDPALGVANIGNLRFLAAITPEPTSIALCGLVFPAGLLALRRRVRRSR